MKRKAVPSGRSSSNGSLQSTPISTSIMVRPHLQPNIVPNHHLRPVVHPVTSFHNYPLGHQGFDHTQFDKRRKTAFQPSV